MDEWIDKTNKFAKENNLLVGTLFYCPVCEDYNAIVDKVVAVNRPLNFQGYENYSGIILFICRECLASLDLEALIDKLYWFEKTGSLILYEPQ